VWSILGVLLMCAGPAHGAVLVTDVSFTARSDGQGYVMRLRTTASPEAYLLRRIDANTLEWVIYNASLHDGYQPSGPQGPVRRYTSTRTAGNLVIRVHLHPDRSVSATTYRDGASSDLLLNLEYADGERPVATAPSPTRSGDSRPAAANSAAASAGPPAAAQFTRRRSRLDTVVIDPGHGGKDPGAMAHGLQEKHIVMDVARKLGRYIETRLGLEVVYTRSDDRFIPLKERGRLANRAGGDLFVSLHANAFGSSSVNGTETYFLGQSKTDAARRVMRTENSVVREYENNPERYDQYDAEAFVKGELFLSANMQFSEDFASIVQRQFKDRVQRRSRGVRQAGFYVLWSASMPAVLVELGYLTNPQEARYLNSDRGQTYLASGLFRAIRSYKNEYNKGIAGTE
jgi:N-acetylmuramoyl-L-alanine amidase